MGIRRILLLFFVISKIAFSKQIPLCYVPGVGGAIGYALETLPVEMEKRGIQFQLFQIPIGKTVAESSKELCPKIVSLLESDPHFQCHIFAYSMGGILTRYAYHHLNCKLPDGSLYPFSKMVKSITTAASPHQGTPLANWLAKQFPNARPEMLDMSEDNIKKYNDPKNKEFYSPEPKSIRVYSFRSFIKDKTEALAWSEYLGYDLLTQLLKKQNFSGDNLLSDGVVPTKSQNFGTVLKDLNVSHSFFGRHGDKIPGFAFADFLEEHYRSL